MLERLAGEIAHRMQEGAESVFFNREGATVSGDAKPEGAFVKNGNEGVGNPEDAFRVEKAVPVGHEHIETINSEFKGKLHPDTAVPYDTDRIDLPDGRKIEGVFPSFDSKYTAYLPEDMLKDTDYNHRKECNRQLGEAMDKDPELRAKFSEEQADQIKHGTNPDGHVWHHHQEPGRMELVDIETHQATRHTGGRSIWGGGSEMRHGGIGVQES